MFFIAIRVKSIKVMSFAWITQLICFTLFIRRINQSNEMIKEKKILLLYLLFYLLDECAVSWGLSNGLNALNLWILILLSANIYHSVICAWLLLKTSSSMIFEINFHRKDFCVIWICAIKWIFFISIYAIVFVIQLFLLNSMIQYFILSNKNR